jgi:hypothetical protein
MRGAIRGAGLLAALVVAACGGGGEPAGPDAAACDLPAGGACDGDDVTRCAGGQLVREPCGELDCGWVDAEAGHGCVDACAAAGVGDEPTCLGDDIARCVLIDGKRRVVLEACGAEATCEAATGAPACASDPCAGIGPLGRCAGDLLTRCVDGDAVATDCAQLDRACAWAGDSAGYACLDPGSLADFVVRGVLRYEDREPLPSGALAPIAPRVARGAQVSLVADAGNQVRATAVTADDGSFVLHYQATAGELVHVLAIAQNPTTLRPVRVVRTSGGQVHGFGGPSFAASPETTVDLLVTDASAVSPAFNILDQGIAAMDVMRDVLGRAAPPQLVARWQRGSNQGTYYTNGTIVLLGASSDDDGYDDTVILHEIGHFVEALLGRTDSPGGFHDGSPTDPRLAWSEGFATYFAMAVRRAPHYMDSNAGGGWGYDADTSVTVARLDGGMSQPVSEDMVSEILWDLGDGGADDDDPYTQGQHGPVLRVQTEYLRPATLRAVGVAGVDLVDFLDGWFVGAGLATCSPVRAIVTVLRGFPYDYAGPAGPCP